MTAKRPKIVSIGGGTGLSTLLRGLKKSDADIAAIVTVTDDGGSSGRLREELGALPPGDIRNCMIALSEDENLMSRLFRFRFQSDGDLHGHSFGNLFLTAMAGITGDFAEAVRLTSEVLAIKGVIYPSTNSSVGLRAEFQDGTWLDGETRITAARKNIRRIELTPPDAPALSVAIDAIRTADAITLGPGSLYTSLIPNLLVQEIADAIRTSSAAKIYIQNIMTQPGETEGYMLRHHIAALIDHTGGDLLFPNIVLNNAHPPDDTLKRYRVDGAELVSVDRKQLSFIPMEILERPLLAEDAGIIRHDSDLLAGAVFEMARVRSFHA